MKATYNGYYLLAFHMKVTEALLAIDPEGTEKDVLQMLKGQLQVRVGFQSRAFAVIPSILKISPDDKDVLTFLKNTAADARSTDQAEAMALLVELGTDPKTFADASKKLFADDRLLVQMPARAYTAWRVNGDAPRTIRLLLAALSDNSNVNNHTIPIHYLGQMGAAAKPAVPYLVFHALTNDYSRRPAAQDALLEIDPEMARRFSR